MERKNVLHLVEYLFIGGIERLLEQLAVNTKELANIHFFSYETEKLQGIGLEIQKQGFPVFTYKKKAGRDWLLVNELIKIIKEHGIQVLHTHDFGPIEYAVILKMRFPKLKLIHTQHTIIHFIRHRKYTFFFQFASYFYTKIIAVSQYTSMTIGQYCPYMKKSAMIVIANGVDTAIFKPRLRVLSVNKLNLISIARISNEKNLNYLLNTCNLLKRKGVPFSFHHAGIGKTSEALTSAQKFIDEHNLENDVFLHGFTNDVLSILNLGDIFLSASHTEGHPVAVLEAMACEMLCLCSDILPHRELGESVVLFDKEEELSLCNLLLQHYQKKAEYNVLPKTTTARKTVIEKFSIEQMVENYVEQYQ